MLFKESLALAYACSVPFLMGPALAVWTTIEEALDRHP